MRKMRWIVLSLAVVALLFGMVGRAEAVPIPIANSGFEACAQTSPTVKTCPLGEGDFTSQSNAATGWTHDGNTTAGVFNPTTAQYSGQAPEGSHVAYSNSAPLSQTLGAPLAANTTYTLQVLVGDRLDTNFPGYQVQLLAGSTILNQCDTCVTPANGTFANAMVTYTTGSSFPAGSLKIVLDSNNIQTNFDNVRLDATPVVNGVPEPTSLLLLGSGLAGLGLWKRSRRRDTQVQPSN
jgi:hapalindole biogenesis HpiC1 cyclase-like protein/PEP-CTERM motif-containing protein